MSTYSASPISPVGGKRRRSRSQALALFAAALIAVPVLPALEEDEKRTRRVAAAGPLVGVVGHWTDTTIGTPGLVVNGERWDGKTSTDALERAGTRLFGTADPAFVTNGMAAGAFPFAVHESTKVFQSGELRVSFNLLGGKSDQFAGVMFGLNARGEYHAARYNTKDGNLAIWAFSNGERRVIGRGTVHAQLPLNKWHTLVVTVRGKAVTVALAEDASLTFTHTLDVAPEGRVGLWAKRDAITAFREFAVRE
ncbi:MAG: hypothetical protein IBJ03_15600 [Gemmatimonadaceae bacterium]|nr:hypothetical protein [Gemmatimonadaceae bacterium]